MAWKTFTEGLLRVGGGGRGVSAWRTWPSRRRVRLSPCRMTHCVLFPFLVTEKILVLWDIDGTLVSTAGAGRRAIDTAFLEVLGVADATAGIRFDGCTDPWICHEVFKVRGIPRSEFARLTREVLERYVENLDEALADPPVGKRFGPLPGIEAALA